MGSVGKLDCRTLRSRNKCFMIVNSGGENPLPGYNCDEKRIRKTFEYLNFNIIAKHDLTANQMNEECMKWAETEDFANDDGVALVILSHGNDQNQLNGIDSQPVKVQTLVEHFINCKSLNNKPKLIFIQACRGAKSEEAFDILNACAASKKKMAKSAGVFIFCATYEDKVAWVGEKTGSPFIKALCTVLEEQAGPNHDLLEIATQVNAKVATTEYGQGRFQAPEFRSSLIYKVYFSVAIS